MTVCFKIFDKKNSTQAKLTQDKKMKVKYSMYKVKKPPKYINTNSNYTTI